MNENTAAVRRGDAGASGEANSEALTRLERSSLTERMVRRLRAVLVRSPAALAIHIWEYLKSVSRPADSEAPPSSWDTAEPTGVRQVSDGQLVVELSPETFHCMTISRSEPELEELLRGHLSALISRNLSRYRVPDQLVSSLRVRLGSEIGSAAWRVRLKTATVSSEPAGARMLAFLEIAGDMYSLSAGSTRIVRADSAIVVLLDSTRNAAVIAERGFALEKGYLPPCRELSLRNGDRFLIVDRRKGSEVAAKLSWSGEGILALVSGPSKGGSKA